MLKLDQHGEDKDERKIGDSDDDFYSEAGMPL